MNRMLCAACACALAIVSAFGETWYWHPTAQESRANYRQNTQSFNYYWYIDSRNWTNALGQTGFPALGDDVVVEDTAQTVGGVCGPLQEDSVYTEYCATNAMHSMTIVNSAVLNQGNVTLQGGGGGFTYLGTADRSNSLGMVLVGDGEVPLDIRNNVTYALQMRMVVYPTTANAVLVKKGIGRFACYYQGNNHPYTIPVTRIQQGTMTVNTRAQVASGVEFWFDGNDASQRLGLGYGTLTNDLPIANGLLGEMNGVDNTGHGVTSDYDNYLHFTGTPKANPMVFTGSFYKNAGLRWAPSNGSVFEISKSRSTTHGRLLVDSGTVRLSNGASFTSLSKVVVANGATLEIGDGSTVCCLAATVNGVDLAEGEHPAASTTGLSGAGTLLVSNRAQMAGDHLILDVPSGTKTLAEALADYNTANGTSYAVADLNGGSLKAYDLIKTGVGTLAMDQKINNYTGSISIEAGIITCTNKYALGATSGITYVRNKATLYCAPPANLHINENRTVHIAGTGADGNGALRSNNAHYSTFGLQNVFCANLILDGDALIRHGAWHYIANNSIMLNGHTLTLKALGSGDACYFPKVTDAGKIVMDGSQSRQPTVTFDSTVAGNEIEFKNSGGWRFWNEAMEGAGRATWNFRFAGPTGQIFGDDNGNGTRDNERHTFFAPVSIAGTVSQVSQGNTCHSWVKIRGVLSGNGTYNIAHANEPGDLHLFNTANTFSGKIYVNRGIVNVYEPGSLPAAATLDLNNGTSTTPGNKEAIPYPPPYHGAAFLSPNRQTLGNITLRGTQPVRVQGGIGAFATVTKTSANTAEYYTGLGADVLVVSNGTVKLPRGAAPGLWEGTNMYANATAVQSAFATSVVHTNLVMRGPHSSNAIYPLNYSQAAATKLITYSGYIWNRTDADATWTFASSVNGPVKVLIDGEEVIATTAAAFAKANKTLAPGAHTFVYRAYNNSPRGGSPWASNCGFMYDVEGRNGTTTNTYTWCVDPGDGSLFTRSVDAADLPLFGEMKFDQGATLDVNGNAYTAASVSGWPTISSSAADALAAPSLTITNKFIVNGATVAANCKMTVNMPLSFGETGGVLATNLERLAHGTFTIASTTDANGISSSGDPLRTRLKTDSKRWHVRVSADGRSLELFYAPGTILSFR